HLEKEEVPGMFGTLVVCLPSRHTGGEMILSHHGQLISLETALSSDFDLSAIAWYSDVKHEIKPVLTGYRLALTYNLARAAGSGERPSAKTIHKRNTEIQRAFEQWQDDDNEPLLVYILGNTYTNVSLSMRNLKGHDRAVCQYLQDICPSNEF
ncbi:hypothetical protein NA57DRAFT_10257, partial [Rhizodiscina lignyota]